MVFKKENIIDLFLASAVIGIGISYEKLYLFHIIFLLASITFLGFNIKKINFNRISFTNSFPLVLLFFYLLSVIWSPNQRYALKYCGYLILGVSIIYFSIYMIKDLKKLRTIIKILGLVFFIELIVCIAESFTNFRYPISPYSPLVTYFGHDYKIATSYSVEIQKIISGVPTGFHWNPNNLATFIAICTPFVLYLKRSWVKLIFLILISIVIYKTKSRGVFISICLISIFYSLTELKFKFKSVLIYTSIFTVLIFTVPSENSSIKLINKTFNSVSYAVESLLFEVKDENNSIGQRQALYSNAFININENKWLGIGAGNSTIAQEKRGKVNDKITSLHNFWIEILVDAGIVVFTLFMTWYFLITYKLHKMISYVEDDLLYYVKSIRLSLLGLLISAISCSSIIYLLPFWVLLGLSLFILKYSKNNYSFIYKDFI